MKVLGILVAKCYKYFCFNFFFFFSKTGACMVAWSIFFSANTFFSQYFLRPNIFFGQIFFQPNFFLTIFFSANFFFSAIFFFYKKILSFLLNFTFSTKVFFNIFRVVTICLFSLEFRQTKSVYYSSIKI